MQEEQKQSDAAEEELYAKKPLAETKKCVHKTLIKTTQKVKKIEVEINEKQNSPEV